MKLEEPDRATGGRHREREREREREGGGEGEKRQVIHILRDRLLKAKRQSTYKTNS